MNIQGFLGDSASKESVCNQVQSLGWEDPLEKRMAIRLSAPVFLPGEFHEQRNLAGYSPWGPKELDMAEQLKKNIRMLINMLIFH